MAALPLASIRHFNHLNICSRNQRPWLNLLPDLTLGQRCTTRCVTLNNYFKFQRNNHRLNRPRNCTRWLFDGHGITSNRRSHGASKHRTY
jgi:hypothetical protein